MKFSCAKLADICDIQSGGTPNRNNNDNWKNGTIPWLKISDLKTKHVFRAEEFISEIGLNNSSAKLFEENTLLITIFATIGEVSILKFRATCNQAIAGINVKQPNIINIEYLYYYFKYYKTNLIKASRGVAQNNINLSILKQLEIPLPSVNDQKIIITALAEADTLIQKRKEAIAKLDELLKSYFIYEVGPKHSSYETWSELSIESLAAQYKGTVRTGPFGSDLKHSEFVDEGVAVLGIDNAVKNYFAWAERRFISEEKYEKLKRYTVKPGDVIITIMGTTGRSAVVPNDIALAITTKHLATITVNRDLVFPEYLSYCIHSHPSILHQIKLANKGAIMDGLNLGIIKGLQLKVPPIEQQQKFMGFYTQVQFERDLMQSQLASLEENFQSLLHQAFTGRLQFRDLKVDEYALKR
ncbi:restriction endonuclease subunit S [Paenibacillus humicus]|uniref:restriction endonuclease subunit S n=1 Tax=Paenibacillus humicus TaxID=412861 RepID=UPI003F134DCC